MADGDVETDSTTDSSSWVCDTTGTSLIPTPTPSGDSDTLVESLCSGGDSILVIRFLFLFRGPMTRQQEGTNMPAEVLLLVWGSERPVLLQWWFSSIGVVGEIPVEIWGSCANEQCPK